MYGIGAIMQVLSNDSTSQTHTMFLMENTASLALNTSLRHGLETHTNNVKEQVKLLYPTSLSYSVTMASTNWMSI